MNQSSSPESTPDIPAGFTPLKMRANPFIDTLGPLYGKREGNGIVLGIRIEERHCSPSGMCHGGMIMSMADMLLIFNSNAQAGSDRFMLTVNLTCDFVGPAPKGEWLEGRAQVLRAGRNMIFTNGTLAVGEQPVARVNGIFKPSGESSPELRGANLL